MKLRAWLAGDDGSPRPFDADRDPTPRMKEWAAAMRQRSQWRFMVIGYIITTLVSIIAIIVSLIK
jgi:hypothetical protein